MKVYAMDQQNIDLYEQTSVIVFGIVIFFVIKVAIEDWLKEPQTYCQVYKFIILCSEHIIGHYIDRIYYSIAHKVS